MGNNLTSSGYSTVMKQHYSTGLLKHKHKAVSAHNMKVHSGSGQGQLSRYSDSLRAGRSGGPIPVEERFSAPVQTGPEAHPASYTMGTGSFRELKRPGRGVDHPSYLAV